MSEAAPPIRRAGQPLRWALAGAVVLGALGALYLLFNAVESALGLWERLQALPVWIALPIAALVLVLAGASGWLVWRLLRPPSRRPAAAAPDRAALEARLAALEQPAAPLAAELTELDRRRAEQVVQVALFGQVSAGKSSLLAALAPHAAPAIGATAGTTRTIAHAEGLLPDGRRVRVADLPGIHEADGEARAEAARDEAARAHALVFVVDAEPTRSEDHELRALAKFGRPLVLALNKADRYRDDELATVLARLRARYADAGIEVCAVSAGHVEQIERVGADGRSEPALRERPARIEALQRQLVKIAGRGPEALEPARERATLARLDDRLATVEVERRHERASECVRRYTRRAVVGALAAVAPGTDLIIQGALATAMLRELCGLHGLKVRELDLDGLVERATFSVRGSTSIVLAIAGNALKAFPGAGTLGGGLVHALAYGLIFDALGRAVADTLARTRALDREQALAAFAERLARPPGERLQALATLAVEALRAPRDDAPATDAPHSRHEA